jgi:hypothetical protein
MRASLALVVLAQVLAASSVARAETAAVLPPSGVNVAPGTLEAAQDVLRGHLAHTGKWRNVVAIPGEIGRTEVEPQAAVALAQGAGADLAVVLHIARLGSAAQVRMTVYATATGGAIYADGMVAASPDDLDRVLQRLAKGLATGKPSGETAELDTVTQSEATAPLKRATTHVFGVSLGVAAPSDGSAVPGLGVYWLYDARSFLADIALGFHTGGGNSDFTLGIGAYYPLSGGDFTPYVGGGARWAASNYDDARGNGIQVYAALGGIAGRLGSLQFRGQLEYFVNTFSSTKTVYDYTATPTSDGYNYNSRTTSSIGQGLGVSIGLGF